MKRSLFRLLLFLCLTPAIWAQERGRVLDFVTGQGVPGVAVTATKSCTNPFGQTTTFTNATLTDADGRYSVSYPIGSSGSSCLTSTLGLSVSKTGYTLLSRKANSEGGNFVALSDSLPRWQQVSAASYGPAATSDMIAAGFGTDLATQTESATSVPLPTTLAGKTVRIQDFTGTERTAQLLFASPSQINFIMPADLEAGAAIVSLNDDKGLTRVGIVTVQKFVPGIFTANADGKGVAAAVIVRVLKNGQQRYEAVARYDDSAQRWLPVPIAFTPETERIVLVLFGTGWRQVASPQEVGIDFIAADERETPGPKRLTVAEYAGKQPSIPGLDQINVELPHSLLGKGETDVLVTINGNPHFGFGFNANRVQISVQ